MNRITIVALAGTVTLLAGSAMAQANMDAVQIKATDLGHKTWMLQGNGGNMTAIVGDDGIILVDTEYAPLHAKIKEALAQLSDQPVKYVINTHLHGDHTGGNQAFGLDGVPIVAQENLKADMAAGTTNALTGVKTPPAPAAYLPTMTYKDSTTVKVKGRTVQVMHMPTSHTNGDSAVWTVNANVLATGDIVSTGMRYPNVDVGDKGDIDGIIKSVDTYLARANANTKFVPGHGELMTKAQLADYRKLLGDARAAVKALKVAGKTEDEVVAAKPLAGDIQGRAGANDMASANFVRLIYRSVS
jgi:glyoxylase-like metal-dependent hydrolase (beta-lactamase superfamily II)